MPNSSTDVIYDYFDINFDPVDDDGNNINKNKSSITNNFITDNNIKNHNSFHLLPNLYSYLKEIAYDVQVINSKTIRVFFKYYRHPRPENRFMLVLSFEAGLINSCKHGLYKISLSSKYCGKSCLSSDYLIQDTPLLQKPIIVQDPQVEKLSTYEITFKNGPYKLDKYYDWVTVAFPTGTKIEADGVIIKIGTLNKRSIKIETPPLIQGQLLTMSMPVTIKPFEEVKLIFGRESKIKNPIHPGQYTIQVKTSKQNWYAVSLPYSIK